MDPTLGYAIDYRLCTVQEDERGDSVAYLSPDHTPYLPHGNAKAWIVYLHNILHPT